MKVRIALLALVIAVLGVVLYFATLQEHESGVINTDTNDSRIGQADILSDETDNELPAVNNDSETESYAIAFPDGDVLRFPKRPRRYSLNEPLPEHVASEYDALKYAAENGDGDAAQLLSRALSSCRFALRDPEELEATINKFYETRLPEYKNDEGTVWIDTEGDLEMAEMMLREGFSRCEGVTDAQIAEEDDWTILAAELGNEAAKSQLANLFLKSKRGYDLSLEEWNLGYPDSLERLGEYYDGRFGAEIVEVDPVTAYAYHYLSTQFFLANLPPGGRIARRWRKEAPKELAKKSDALSPRENAAAMELAKSILRENKSCCFSN